MFSTTSLTWRSAPQASCPSLSSGQHRWSSAREQRARLRATVPSSIGASIGDDWNEDDFLEVGVLGGPHGVKGEVTVQVMTSFPEERFGTSGVRYIQPPERAGLIRRDPVPPSAVTLQAGRQHVVKGRTIWLLKFQGCATRDAAASLRGFRLMVRADERPPLDDEDEVYAQDLVGLEVVLSEEGSVRDGTVIGTVVDVYDGTGTYDVVRIAFDERMVLAQDGALVDAGTLSSGSESEGEAWTQSSATGLLPFAKAFVPEVDVADGCIEITPPDGWLEMYLTPKAVAPPQRERKRRRRRRSNRKDAVAAEQPAPDASSSVAA